MPSHRLLSLACAGEPAPGRGPSGIPGRPGLAEAAAGAREAASLAGELEARVARLTSVAAPPDLADLGTAIADAADLLAAATKALEEAEDE